METNPCKKFTGREKVPNAEGGHSSRPCILGSKPVSFQEQHRPIHIKHTKYGEILVASICSFSEFKPKI